MTLCATPGPPDLRAACGVISAAKDGRPAGSHHGIEAARLRLTRAFAKAHGWRPSRKSFSPAELGQADLPAWERPSSTPWGWLDHAFFFRHPDGTPAAVACHVYLDMACMVEIEDVMVEHSLDVSFPDFPSWWSPGRTTLVLFEPANVGGRP